MRIGFIGLGAMGEPMARNLASANFLNVIWNRTTEKAEVLAKELGVHKAKSPEKLAKKSDVVFTCVSADDDVLDVIWSMLPGLGPGKIVVDTSTVSSATAKSAAKMLEDKGASFLDAPVSGGVEGAKNATLAMMIGGESDVLNRVKSVLDVLATRIVLMGPTGSGQGTKAVNQAMAAGINQAVTEALAFAHELGLPMDKVIDVISGGAAGNWFLEHRGPSMTHAQFQPGFKVELHQKDLRICKRMAEEKGLKLPLTIQTITDYEILIQEGYGEEDISALYRLKP
ncbi:MAG TPA: NAD(P)-dependent oxidoreductase [Crenotrichaceae bacterium]|nr:NAD(P)-dependent oxidoreductase [Crenotrichaceae bacterium]